MFSIDPRNLPRAYSYEAAVQLFDSLAWFRKEPDKKMLYNQRSTHFWAKRQNDDIIFGLYETPVITWHSPDRFTLVPWQSVSTSAFASCFTPNQIHLNSTAVLTTREGEFKLVRATLISRTAGVWRPDFDCVEPQFTYTVNHSVAKAAREKYRDLQAWLKISKAVPGISSGYSVMEAAELYLKGRLTIAETVKAAGMYLSDGTLERAMVVVSGAVTATPAPLGEIPTSKYAKFHTEIARMQAEREVPPERNALRKTEPLVACV